MFRRRNTSLSLLISVLTLSLMLLAHGAIAQAATSTQDSSNALKISPVRTDVEISPGQSKVLDVYVQNVGTGQAHLRAIVNDFIANKDESGSPSIILDANQTAPSHSLKTFVAPISNITLQPDEQKDVKVTVTIPKTAAAGGYYGVVRFEPVSPGSNSQSLTLSASIGSLVLVKVPGAIKENVTIASFDVQHNNHVQTVFTSGKGIQVVTRFQNNGDIQEEPFGKILVRKGGQTLASYDINTTSPRGNVLPDSIRRFTTNLNTIGSFGKYTVEGSFGYGSKGQLLVASKTIYVIPVSLLAVIGGALIVVLLVIFVLPRVIKNYNRRVVQKAVSKKK